jgi:hypothetical protein
MDLTSPTGPRQIQLAAWVDEKTHADFQRVAESNERTASAELRLLLRKHLNQMKVERNEDG